MSTARTWHKASHWFKTEADLRRVCADAVSLARGESNEQFASDTLKKVNQYGMSTIMTDKQIAYLCRLADCVVPLPLGDDDAER